MHKHVRHTLSVDNTRRFLEKDLACKTDQYRTTYEIHMYMYKRLHYYYIVHCPPRQQKLLFSVCLYVRLHETLFVHVDFKTETDTKFKKLGVVVVWDRWFKVTTVEAAFNILSKF